MESTEEGGELTDEERVKWKLFEITEQAEYRRALDILERTDVRFDREHDKHHYPHHTALWRMCFDPRIPDLIPRMQWDEYSEMTKACLDRGEDQTAAYEALMKACLDRGADPWCASRFPALDSADNPVGGLEGWYRWWTLSPIAEAAKQGKASVVRLLVLDYGVCVRYGKGRLLASVIRDIVDGKTRLIDYDVSRAFLDRYWGFDLYGDAPAPERSPAYLASLDAVISTLRVAQVRQMWSAVRSTAHAVGRIALFVRSLFDEVHYRPGGLGFKRCRAEFEHVQFCETSNMGPSKEGGPTPIEVDAVRDQAKVFVHSLRYRTDLNGCECIVLNGPLPSTGKWRLLCGGEILNVKESNVEDCDSFRARLDEQCAYLSPVAVDAVEDNLVLSLLKAAVDAVAQCADVKAVLVAQREAEEEEEHRQRQLADEAARREGFADDDDRCYYEYQYLDMRRRYRRDPEWFKDALDSGLDPNDPDGDVDEDGAPWGCHPFYDYGYVRCLGKGRVLWDELRPVLTGKVQRIKLESIVVFWQGIAAETAMRPVSLGGIYDPVAAVAAELPSGVFA